MKHAVLALALALAGCGLPRAPRPHPPMPAVHVAPRPAPRAPCVLPAPPTFPDSDEALATASGLAERVMRLRAGRDARIDYERGLRAVCR